MVILFESPLLVVVDKPPGVPTIPDRFGSDSVHGKLQVKRNERLWIVHRLDREVSGVLVFARDAETHRALSVGFERHEIRKTYEALTEGTAAPGAHRWENLLLRGKKRAYESPHGKPAITEATCLGAHADGLRWRLHPVTGRNHQLRVHLMAVGCPIRGDVLYGATRPWPAGIALRAVAIDLPPIGRDAGGAVTAPTLFDRE